MAYSEIRDGHSFYLLGHTVSSEENRAKGEHTHVINFLCLLFKECSVFPQPCVSVFC